MNTTTLNSLGSLSQKSGLAEVLALSRQESNEIMPSIETQLRKLAATETVSFSIEALLLLLVLVFGLITVAYGVEQVFSFLQNEPVATGLAHLTR
jgi:hypothetical protein